MTKRPICDVRQLFAFCRDGRIRHRLRCAAAEALDELAAVAGLDEEEPARVAARGTG